MVLYHGSIVIVDKPEIRKGSTKLDFGVGFYLTSSYERAKRWAKVKIKRDRVSTGYVFVDKKWLNFVFNNRKGISSSECVDIHVGPVANDNIYNTIRLFESGAYDEEYTIKTLKTEKLTRQWVFHTSESLSFLKFIEAKEIK